METRRLKYFVRIADDGSLMKASGVLRIAQPALSRQLRLLEEELGVQLFQRTSRGMRLTDAGERLRSAIAGPLRDLDLALQNMRSASSPIAGDVTIGMPSTVGDAWALPLVERMSSTLPSVKLRMAEGLTGSLIDWLLRGVVDFALIEETAGDERLSNRALRSDKLMLVGAAGSGLQANRAVTFREVARLPLIVPSHHLGIRSALNAAAAKVRKTLNIQCEADSSRLLKQLVERGMGFTVLPSTYFKTEQLEARLESCPIVNPTLSLTTFLSRRHYQPTNSSTADVIESAIVTFFAGR